MSIPIKKGRGFGEPATVDSDAIMVDSVAPTAAVNPARC